MSEIKSNKISPRRGTTTTIGDSGDSVTISSGTTTTNAGTISTAGITGGTINNTTGSIEGLQQQVSWQTGSIKTGNFSASANEGYFLDTTSGEITVTFPASPTAGDVIAIKDYADTFDTNKALINPNGNKIQGTAANFQITVEGTAAIFLYIDSTKGWLLVDQSKASDVNKVAFVAATGGTITNSPCGNFKIHTFTGPGTFCVSCAGTALGSNTMNYLVVAGGASGGGPGGVGGGGGAGGWRCVSCSPLSVQAYPVTVGGGGTMNPTNAKGGSGSNSVFNSTTSAGGGGGGLNVPGATAASGGSGGGGGGDNLNTGPGAGNTPPVSPSQGNNGGSGGGPNQGGGGGGGAGSAGTNESAQPGGGVGGNGKPWPGNCTLFAGGGGGDGGPADTGPGNNGGPGGGGTGGPSPTAGTTNTGGGGGGGANGGSGIVIIKYKFQ
tara:strand:- start:221 stop:1534 length:1314 start_codon:yes stop_codon:yes gene_type:complete